MLVAVNPTSLRRLRLLRLGKPYRCQGCLGVARPVHRSSTCPPKLDLSAEARRAKAEERRRTSARQAPARKPHASACRATKVMREGLCPILTATREPVKPHSASFAVISASL